MEFDNFIKILGGLERSGTPAHLRVIRGDIASDSEAYSRREFPTGQWKS